METGCKNCRAEVFDVLDTYIIVAVRGVSTFKASPILETMSLPFDIIQVL